MYIYYVFIITWMRNYYVEYGVFYFYRKLYLNYVVQFFKFNEKNVVHFNHPLPHTHTHIRR